MQLHYVFGLFHEHLRFRADFSHKSGRQRERFAGISRFEALQMMAGRVPIADVRYDACVLRIFDEFERIVEMHVMSAGMDGHGRHAGQISKNRRCNGVGGVLALQIKSGAECGGFHTKWA